MAVLVSPTITGHLDEVRHIRYKVYPPFFFTVGIWCLVADSQNLLHFFFVCAGPNRKFFQLHKARKDAQRKTRKGKRKICKVQQESRGVEVQGEAQQENCVENERNPSYVKTSTLSPSASRRRMASHTMGYRNSAVKREQGKWA